MCNLFMTNVTDHWPLTFLFSEKSKTLNNLGAQTLDSQDPNSENTENTEGVVMQPDVSTSEDLISIDQVTERTDQSELTQSEENIVEIPGNEKSKQSNLQPDTESGVVVQENEIAEEASKGELTNEGDVPVNGRIEHCDNDRVESDVSNVAQDNLESQTNPTENVERGQTIHIENT